MKFILILLAVVTLLYVLALMGRRGNPDLAKFRGWNFAHRGLHGNGLAENSLSAFRAAVDHGYGAEFDVHLMKDGRLAVIHDSLLARTTGAPGRIEDLTVQELGNYHLEGTQDHIPTLEEVLAVFGGKTPLIIELKAENNAAALCQAACAALEGYSGDWCMESFDPRCVHWLRKNRPQVVRGQLAENYFIRKGKLPWGLKLILSFHLENFLTRPDFVAYDFGTRKNVSNWLCRKLWGIQGVTWTLRSQQDHNIAVGEGWIPIFEHYIP